MKGGSLLFFEEDLHGQLHARQKRVSDIINSIPIDQFLISSDQELIEHVLDQLAVDPIVLHEDRATMNQRETRIDVSGDKMRYFSPDQTGPFYIPGTQVDINIPFSGDAWIFRYRPSAYFSVFPRAEIRDGYLRLSIARPHDADPTSFKSAYEQEIKLIRKYVDHAHKQVIAYYDSLPNLAQQAINFRRERLEQHSNIADILEIPLAPKPGAPSITPVKLEIRRPPALPVPPKTGLKPEPGITDKTFELILQFIRHQGRTFERTPSTFAVHSEEELRNIILAQLNGHFQGNAAGEAFRYKGKTDICIEQDNRAAFVGECKMWSGEKGLIAALNQLLGYLTWRDSKSALIIFNTKNKNFSKIVESMPEILHAHPLFLRALPYSEAGEWRVLMRSREDEGRRVMVHVFVFNLYQTPEPRVRVI